MKLLSILVIFLANAAASSEVFDFFPLKKGNKWVYSATGGEGDDFGGFKYSRIRKLEITSTEMRGDTIRYHLDLYDSVFQRVISQYGQVKSILEDSVFHSELNIFEKNGKIIAIKDNALNIQFPSGHSFEDSLVKSESYFGVMLGAVTISDGSLPKPVSVYSETKYFKDIGYAYSLNSSRVLKTTKREEEQLIQFNDQVFFQVSIQGKIQRPTKAYSRKIGVFGFSDSFRDLLGKVLSKDSFRK